MWPRDRREYYAPTSFCGSLCNTISSCLSLLCCCWLFQDCLGGQRRPMTPLIGPPSPPRPGPIDARLADLGGPHSPFGVPNPYPPGPPGPPRPPFQHGSLQQPGPWPPNPYGGPPGPPSVPSVL